MMELDRDDLIVNKVEQSGIITIDPSDFMPGMEIKSFDISPLLAEGLVLREKDFRICIQQINWAEYRGGHVAVYCSTDAIIPYWAYMLIASHLAEFATSVRLGRPDEWKEEIALQNVRNDLNPARYQNARLVVKGCSDRDVPVSVYMEIVKLVRPFASSIMYGEPCSTVPVFKRKKS
jgi:hypothetical protein